MQTMVKQSWMLSKSAHLVAVVGIVCALLEVVVLAQAPLVRPLVRENISAPESLPNIPPQQNVSPLPAPKPLREQTPAPATPPLPPAGNPGAAGLPEPIPAGPAIAALSLAEVLESLDRFFPLLYAVSQERGIAAGDLLAAEGAFDLKISGASISQPMDYYKNYRNSVGLEQPTWNGGKLSTGYRIGDGRFEPWYGERETNEGGEFALGASLPFWKDRAIDKRRAEILKAEIKTRLAEPKITKSHIEFARQASYSYWNWVASVQSEAVYREYLRIAKERDDFIQRSIRFGNMAEVEQIDNRRVIASRDSALIAANRKSRKAAIDMSLYLREPTLGQPLLVESARAPQQFPAPQRPAMQALDSDIEFALRMNPEIYRLRLEQQRTGVQLDYAKNQALPDLQGGLYTSKDVGGEASPSGNKTPLKMEAGLLFEVPLQRRNARGQIRSTEAELSRLRAEERYAADYTTTKVQDAIVALDAAYQRIDLAVEAVELAKRMEDVERTRFAAGQSNILFVNLREVTTNDSRLMLIGAYADYFFALADYRAALSANTPMLTIQP
jgi:outer membrane protein TolC